MNRIIAFILLGVLTLPGLPWVTPVQAEESQTSSTHRSTFFEYLTDKKTPPALIDYSPTDFDPRHGQNFRLPSPSSIEEDLRKLRQAFDGLIVYSYHPKVTPIILEKAKQLDFQAIVLGIWDARSIHEIHGVIELIHQYGTDMTLALCLGNEGLYFHRYSMNDLIVAEKIIQHSLKSHTQIPITTSEPWESYRTPTLYTFGDFLAPNIHPVWVKPALPAKDAVYWTRTQAISLMEKANKPVLVKETGFPHAGQRHFTPLAQKQFWDMYVREDRLVYSPTNPLVWTSFATSFEAFSLPWKAEQSGEPIEAAWGLMSHDRTPFPAFYTWSQAQASSR